MDNKILKKAFIDAYKKTFGNISQSCKRIKISRQTYYNWMEKDEEFKKQLDGVEPEEVFIDFAENALVKRIQEGDTTAIIFTLKTKGKKRGYIERQEIEHKGEIDTGSKEVAKALREIIESDE
jgi:hypothetical protein